MYRKNRLLYSDLDINVQMGNLLFNIMNINYEPPTPLRHFATHSHTSYELHFIPSGKGTLRVFQNTYEIVPGTFYLTGPGIYHEQDSDETDPMIEYCINFDFTVIKENKNKRTYYSQKEMREINHILANTNFWFGYDNHSTYELFEKILSELNNQTLGYYTNIQSLVSQIIICAVRCYASEKKASYSIPPKMLYDKRRSIMDCFFREYCKPLKPKNLAAQLGISARQLDRIMYQYYSMSFKEKLISTRLEIAKDLLRSTDMTIEQIAAETGFSYSSYFCKLFKQRELLSPTDYRKTP